MNYTVECLTAWCHSYWFFFQTVGDGSVPSSSIQPSFMADSWTNHSVSAQLFQAWNGYCRSFTQSVKMDWIQRRLDDVDPFILCVWIRWGWWRLSGETDPWWMDFLINWICTISSQEACVWGFLERKDHVILKDSSGWRWWPNVMVLDIMITSVEIIDMDLFLVIIKNHGT